MNNSGISDQVLTLLLAGKVKQVNKILGYEHTLRGEVVHGNHLGRKLGFPTANIVPDSDTPLLLGHGVYLVRVEYDHEYYKGLTNIGLRPTINGTHVTIEVYIFDFNKDLYGHHLKVWFLDRIRMERKFESLEALKRQIEKDKIKAMSLFSRLD